MNWRAIQAIARRDLLIVLRSKGVLIPMIILPVLMLVLLPGGIAALAPAMAEMPGSDADFEMMLQAMPSTQQAHYAALPVDQVMVELMIVHFFAPMFLIIPLMVASTIAANSFAGEKERKTLEALIYTPTTDLELLVGKLLTAWIPALIVTLAGFLLYALVVNVAAWPTMGRIFFPNLMWLVLVAWVAPAAAGLGLSSMVLVSAKANSFQEAYQIGGVVVVPVVALMLGQVSGVMYLSIGVLFIVGLVFWLIDGAILWYSARTFHRNEMIARL